MELSRPDKEVVCDNGKRTLLATIESFRDKTFLLLRFNARANFISKKKFGNKM